jgi:regulator of protease activity HflC (stomatin/prohibitin superfamily)
MSVGQWIKNYRITVASILFVLFFCVVYFFNSIFIYVFPGQSAVLFSALSDEPIHNITYREGLYVVAPWNKMYIYDTTQQKKTVDVDALTVNGLHVIVRVSALFHPDQARLKELVVHTGSGYTDKILVPYLFSSVRKTIGRYLPQDLYTTAGQELQKIILSETQKEIADEPFLVESIVIEKLELPKTINQAVENKLRLQQEALAYEFILKKEHDESTRRKIEAESIREYQNIVGSNLNKDILKWLEIRALRDIGKSPNSKVVIMGGGNSVPLVINPEG